MPFGLTNAPTVFQRFMNDIFSNLLDVCVMIYLDDILIYSNNMSKHHQHVKKVLKCLRKASLYAKVEKYEFHSKSVEYLEYILSPSGLTMSDNRVKIIHDWLEPKKVKDIQSFLGFANFYCWFIFNYSDYALAAILSIVNKDNEVHPVAFHSRTFTAVELNYNTHNKELLAIFEAFKIWQHYLEGPAYPIDIVTDHKNLEYFSTTKVLTWRQVQWSKYLSQFNLVIRFCSGHLGTNPDTLTRQWNVYPKGGNTGYATVNPHNFKPILTQEQLAASI